MDSQRFRSVFLSRATTEFGMFVSPIRTAALDNYPMLDVSDQLFPPDERNSLTAEETVRHLRKWVERVDTVLHFVGTKAGSRWKVPDSGLENLLRLLDFSSQQWLDDLVKYFRTNNLSESEISYTHLEGVMAIAQGKKPWILWLTETKDSAIDPSQKLYRNWLKENYLSGRDRCDADSISELVQTAYRKLAEWNERTRIEWLARNTQDVALWDNVFDLSQPGINNRELEHRWRELLQYQSDTAVDWIKQRNVCGEPRSMLIFRASQPLLKWIVPMQGKVGILANTKDNWMYEETTTGGNVRAVCQDNGDFHLLVEKENSGSQIVSTSRKTPLEVDGLHTHSFGAFSLWKTEDGFGLASGGQFWRVASDVLSEPQSAVSAEVYQPESTDRIDSGVLPQFSKPMCFPFLRRFRGATFDYHRDDRNSVGDSDVDESWALVEWHGKLHHLVMNQGDFTDAFKTVDLVIPGTWCLTQIVSSKHTYWLQMTLGKDCRYLPLFPTPDPAPPLLLSQLPSDSPHASMLRKFKLSRFMAKNQFDSVVEPFCFIGSKIGERVNATRLLVWLIPALPIDELLSKLRDRICGLTPLSETPIRKAYLHEDLDKRLDSFSDVWWDCLWANCSVSTR